MKAWPERSLGVSQGKGEVVGGSVGGDADKLTKLQGKMWILSPSKTPLYCCQVKLIKTALQRLRCLSVFPLSPRGKIINKQLLPGNQQVFASSYMEMAAFLIMKHTFPSAAELLLIQPGTQLQPTALHATLKRPLSEWAEGGQHPLRGQ